MKRYVYLVLIVTLVTMLVVGCTDNSTDHKEGIAEPAATTSTTNETEIPNLEIVSHQLNEEDAGGYNVTGTAKAAKTLSYAEVKVKFYDKNGALIETSLDSINNLEAGKTWNFKVTGPLDDSVRIEDYKISVWTCV